MPIHSIKQLQISYVINGNMQEKQVYFSTILTEVTVIMIMATIILKLFLCILFTSIEPFDSIWEVSFIGAHYLLNTAIKSLQTKLKV